MKTTFAVLALAAAALASAAPAPAHSYHSLVIRHQVRGCHAWSIDGGAWKARQSAHVSPGGVVMVTNYDVMPHRLVQLAGPRVRMKNVVPALSGHMGIPAPYAPGMMGRMHASVKVTFARPGVYRFRTVAGEDYMPGMKTIGPDNRLVLTVEVM